MFETFHTIRRSLCLIAVLCILLGAALLIYPSLFLQIACYVVGALLIAAGVLGIIDCVRDHLVRVVTVTFSVIAAAAGIYIIANPKMISSLLPLVFGLILVLDGLFNVRHGIGLRHYDDPHHVSVMVLGIITVVLGAVILCNPYSAAEWSFRLIGVALVYNGLSDIFVLFRVNHAGKQYANSKKHPQGYIDVDARPVDDDEED